MGENKYLQLEMYTAILDVLPHPVLILGQDGCLLYANLQANSSFSLEDICSLLRQPDMNGRTVETEERKYRCEYRTFNAFVVWFLTDITELETLRASNQEWEVIFNSSFDEIFVTDGEGVVLRINPAGERLYGVAASQMIGKKAEDLSKAGYFSPSLTPQILQEKKRMSMVQTTWNGQTIYVTGNPVFDEAGNVVKIIFNSRNMTDFTLLERRLEATESLLTTYRTELLELTKTIPNSQIVVQSEAMKRVVSIFSKVAPVDSTVLITGESGVGKSKMAELIHEWSARKDKPFIQVNCGTIPDTLFESELFGYEGGAFTGARKDGKKGMIELAEGGTLFLDEIGELPLHVQVKLLQVIQEHQFRRVGGDQIQKSNIRIIAATNRDLKKLVEAGTFREDLFFRLNVIPIQIPPLRHRTEEIPFLLDIYLKKYNDKYGLKKTVDHQVREILLRYRWPGNVRELENLLERLVLTSDHSVINTADLPDGFQFVARPSNVVTISSIVPLKQAVEAVEAELLKKAYKEHGSTYKMAEVLHVNQSTVVRKLQRYQSMLKED